MCISGKTQFSRRKVALGAASHLRKNSGHSNVNAYKCGLCSCWHVGHSFKTDEQRNATQKIFGY